MTKKTQLMRWWIALVVSGSVFVFFRWRRSKLRDDKPEVVDPRYEGLKTDMNIYDPSGNLLVFWRSDRAT